MFSVTGGSQFSDKNQRALESLALIGRISERYIERLKDHLAYKNTVNAETLMKIMKHDLIQICELFRNIKVNHNQEFKDQYYFKVIKREDGDVIDIIRHGLAHLDMIFRSEEKFDFYQLALKTLTCYASLNVSTSDVKKLIKEGDIVTASFDEVKKSGLYRHFERVREKTKGLTSVVYKMEFKQDVSQNLISLINYILNECPKDFDDECKVGIQSFKAKHLGIYVALAEMGEILNQTKNFYQGTYLQVGQKGDRYTVYLKVNDKKIWLSPEFINNITLVRKGLHHLNQANNYLSQIHESINFIKENFEAPVNKSSQSLKIN